MVLKHTEKYLNIIPIAALSLVLVIDIISFLRRSVIMMVPYIRELLIVLGILCVIFMIYQTRWLRGKTILAKVKLLAVTIVGLYIGYFLPKIVLLSGFEMGQTGTTGYFSSLNVLIYSTLTSLSVTFLCIIALHLLGYLIYIKRRKTTHRNFLFTIIIMAGQFLYLQGISVAGSKPVSLSAGGPIGAILLISLIVSFVINSSRNSWIYFFNRSQKIALFFAGFLLVPISYGLVNIPLNQVIAAYSPSLGILTMQTSLFIFIYLVIAELILLFHLPTAGLYDKKTREISTYHQLSRSISMEFNPDKVVDQITQQSLSVIDADANWLELIDHETGKLEIVSSNRIPDSDRDILKATENDQIALWIIKNKRHILINDISKDEKAAVFRTLDSNIASLVAVPLISYEKLLGILFAVKYEQYGFADEHVDTLQAFADQAAIALENARLVRESIEKERLEQELKIAHDAQMKLLPKSMPRLSNYQIEAICVTANEVGGDYYDFFQLSKDKLGIVIGDVSGKGPEAAFHMAEIKGVIESLSHIYESPMEILIRTNKIIYENLDPDMFITLSYGILDTKTNTLKFSRAGHCPLIHYVYDEDEVRLIEPHGIGVGLEKGDLFTRNIEEIQIKIQPADILLFYTDGIVEAQNTSQEEFGEERLQLKVKQLKDETASDMMRKIIQSIQSFAGSAKPHDDLSMVIVKQNHHLR